MKFRNIKTVIAVVVDYYDKDSQVCLFFLRDWAASCFKIRRCVLTANVHKF